MIYYGALYKHNGKLSGYMLINQNSLYAELVVQKAGPIAEKLQINAALIYGALKDMNHLLNGNYYFVDGERSINHKTEFRNYLIKYFGFRKAYCKMDVAYRFPLQYFINIVYPMRAVFKRLDNIVVIHKINVALEMEYIKKSFKMKK